MSKNNNSFFFKQISHDKKKKKIPTDIFNNNNKCVTNRLFTVYLPLLFTPGQFVSNVDPETFCSAFYPQKNKKRRNKQLFCFFLAFSTSFRLKTLQNKSVRDSDLQRRSCSFPFSFYLNKINTFLTGDQCTLESEVRGQNTRGETFSLFNYLPAKTMF